MKIKRFFSLLLITLHLFLALSCTQAITWKDPMLILPNTPFSKARKGVIVQLFSRDLCGKKEDPKPCADNIMDPVRGATIEAGFDGFDWKTSAVTDKSGQAFISFENLPLAIIFSDQAKFMVRTEVYGKKLQKELRLSKTRLTELVVALEIPPRLITSLSFSDQNGNNLLDADESGEITFKIKNQGRGIANKVFVQMRSEKEYRYVDIDQAALKGMGVGDLKPGEEAVLKFEIRARELVESDNLSLLIDATEAKGYDADTVSLSLRTKALPRPNLVVAKIGIEEVQGNANGVIDRGEMIKVKAIVENRGEGKAEKVVARISTNDSDIRLFQTEHHLGDIAPGISVPIIFSFSITKRYSGSRELPITIDFLPNRKLFQQHDMLAGLILDGFTPPISSVVIGARELPSLSYTVNLEDANKNKADLLKGGEEYSLHVFIENTGTGTAKGVGVVLSGHKRLIEYLGGNQVVGDILPGGKKEVILSGKIPEKVPEQQVDLIVELNEQRGYVPAKAIVLPVATRQKATVFETDVDTLPEAVNIAERKDDLAIVVGIRQYDKITTPVKYARHDAEIMSKYLHRLLGVPESRIKKLYDRDATVGNINALLEDFLPGMVKPNSRVYFYFSGHGTPEVKSQKAYLVPADGNLDLPSTLYPVEKVFSRLNALQAKELVVMLDSCFAGEGPRSVIPGGAKPMGIDVEDPLRAPGRIISIAAAQVKQISSDLDEMQHGLFTYYMLKGLRGEADTDHDGTVKLSELFKYVQSNVKEKAAEISREQEPVLSPSLVELGERANLPFATLISRGVEPREKHQ